MVEMPRRIAQLPRNAQGWPIPYFVDRPANGSLDFRVMHPRHMALALTKRLCWICGQPMGRYIGFVGGPLSVAQRLFSDPAAHRDCAEYALIVCPFLASPNTQRRDADMPEHTFIPEPHVQENPGVFGLLITRDYQFQDTIIQAGEPLEIHWYSGGHRATRAEVEAAIAIARRRDEVLRHPHRDHILSMLDRVSLPPA